MKKLFKIILVVISASAAFLFWNKPGIGGQVAHNPTKSVTAWVSHKGWAGLNGKYTLTLTVPDGDDSRVIQRFYFKCSSKQFAQMRETTHKYLSWSKDGSVITVDIPNEFPLKIEINI